MFPEMGAAREESAVGSLRGHVVFGQEVFHDPDFVLVPTGSECNPAAVKEMTNRRDSDQVHECKAHGG